MAYNLGAVVTDGIVDRIIVIEPCAIPAVKEAMGFEYLISVDDTVQIGDTYDPEKSIFLRNGVRVFPDKTDSERIAELEQEINDVQMALCEIYESR